MKRFQKIVALLLGIATVGWIGGIDSVKAVEFLSTASVTLSNPVAKIGGTGQAGTQTFTFKTKTPGATTAIKSILLSYMVAPAEGSNAPSTSVAAAGTWDSVSGGMGNLGDWTPTFGAGSVTLTNTATVSVAADTVMGFVLGNISNPGISPAGTNNGDCPAAVGDASNTEGTCYINIKTRDAGNATIDETTVSYTVTTPVQVKARVESQLSFWVTGTTSAEAVPGLNTTNYTANSTYSLLDFGSVVASSNWTEGNANNKSEYQGQKLYVKTNASKGYSVTASLNNGAGVARLEGTYGGNNIAGSGNAWATPAAWAQPAGRHGFFAAHTNDADVTGFGTANKVWGDLTEPTTGGVEVMKASGPDAGTTPAIVSYGITVDVQQPADQYTGTITYNCTGKY